jgi:surface carbohydrate biosynthesis protein
MQNIDILFFYEHVTRELDVACLVKHYAETRHGLTVEIAHQYHGVAHALAHWSPRLVVIPFCYSDSPRHYPFIYDWHHAIYFNMAWEELLYPGNREAKLPRGVFETKYVLHHAWSTQYAELIQARGVTPAHIFVNGNPAYTLYDAPYRHFFDDRATLAEKYGLDARKRWIFFPENYNWAFYQDWRFDALEREGLQRQTLDSMKIFSRDSFRSAMEWCAALATASDVEIILRPRPTTPLKEFQDAVTAVCRQLPPNLHLNKDASVREWILASDVVLSSYSTSLIEAAVADKPAYMLEPYPVPASLRADWHVHAPRLETYAAFANACLDTSRHENRLGAWARRGMMANGDSIVNLADYLARVLRRQTTRPAPPSRRAILGDSDNRLRAFMRFEKRRRQGRAQRLSPRPLSRVYEKDVVPYAEINARVARWAERLAQHTPA